DAAEIAYGRSASVASRSCSTAECKLAFGVGELALELAALIDDRGKPHDHRVWRDFEQLRRLAHALVLGGKIGARGFSGERLDPPHAGGARAFAYDLHEAAIAPTVYLRT